VVTPGLDLDLIGREVRVDLDIRDGQLARKQSAAGASSHPPWSISYLQRHDARMVMIRYGACVTQFSALVVLPLALACASLPGARSSATSGIDNFRSLSAGLYGGARPGDEGLAYLKRIGVKTIVDLEIANPITGNARDIEHERVEARRLGIDWVHKPMSAFETVDDAQMTEILAILRDPASRPVFVHCRYGKDRTSLVIALERVIDEGWSAQAAHDEMIDHGFRWPFISLNHYFEEKTGWED
jgi:tyrosine-protein phosphatase SIW14